LLIIGILAFLSHSGLYLATKTQDKSAALINISGRQRMLSQRAATFALRLVNSTSEKDRAKLRSSLLKIVTKMEESHSWLLYGNHEDRLPNELSDDVRSIFFKPPIMLDKKMREFIGEVKILIAEPDESLLRNDPHVMKIVDMSEAELLDALDTLVNQYQKESEEMIDKLKGIGIGVFGLIIFALFLEDVFIFRPLGEHVQTKASELAESERKLRDVTAALGDGVYVTDSSGRLTLMNPEAQRLLGWTEGELMGKSIHNTIHFQKTDGSPNPFKGCPLFRTLRFGESCRVEEDVFTRKDGTAFPISLVTTPIKSNSAISGAAVIFHDITERKEAERKLVKKTKLIQLLSDIAMDANESTTADEAMLACLKRVCAYSGWEAGHVYIPDEEGNLAPTTLWCIKNTYYFNRFRMITEDVTFAPGEGLPGRAYQRREPVWITDILGDDNFPRARLMNDINVKSGFAFPVFERGEVAAVLEFFSSETHEPDESLLEMARNLSSHLGRLTERKRDEMRLVKAKEKAEDATALKDKFVSLVAHDLRSPLATIIGFVDAITSDRTHALYTAHKNGLEHVRKNIEALINMIDRLLNITRLQAGKIKLDLKFIDGHIIACNIIRNLKHMAENKEIALINNVPPNLRLYADPDLFTEVIQNLVTNAIKFCPKGGTVTMFSLPGRPAGISVKDTGKGIDPEIIHDIFKHEIKTTTRGTMGEKGTGLGLPFCHDIMMAHGGSLIAESTEGKGAIFHAGLPEAKPIVLVIDGDGDMRHTYRVFLEDMDMDVLEAADGEEAVSILKTNTPDLVILDIVMPKMNGFEMLELLKKDFNTKFVPIIVATSDYDVEISERAFRLGAADVLNKPLEPNVFLPKVRMLVESTPRVI